MPRPWKCTLWVLGSHGITAYGTSKNDAYSRAKAKLNVPAHTYLPDEKPLRVDEYKALFDQAVSSIRPSRFAVHVSVTSGSGREGVTIAREGIYA